MQYRILVCMVTQPTHLMVLGTHLDIYKCIIPHAVSELNHSVAVVKLCAICMYVPSCVI